MPSADTGRANKPVVVGIDGSPASVNALRWAAEYAWVTNGCIEVVVVWDWYRSPGWYTPVLAGLDPEGNAKKVLKKVIVDVQSEWPHVSMTGHVTEGKPSPILAEASKGASLLVLGSRGHGEFTGMLIGSVSEYCVTHAHCPVLVYRDT